MENVNFIFWIFIPSSYIKNLLEIVVKLKIKKKMLALSAKPQNQQALTTYIRTKV